MMKLDAGAQPKLANNYSFLEAKLKPSINFTISTQDKNGKKSPFSPLEKTSSALEFLKKIFINTVLLGFTLALCVYAYYEIYNTQTYIEPISIPKSLSDLGYSSEVASQRLWVEIKNIQQDTDSHKQELDLAKSADNTDINIPDTAISIKKTIRYIKSSLNIKENVINGEFICKTAECKLSGLSLRLRIIGNDIKFVTMPAIAEENVDKYFHDAALKIVEVIDPYRAALYLQDRNADKAQRIAARMSVIGNEDQKWGFLFLGNYSLNIEQETGKAYDYFQRAAKIDDKFAMAYVNMAVVDLNNNRINESRNNILKARALLPNSSTPLRVLAEISRKENDYKAAEAYYKQAIAMNSRDNSVLSSYGAFQFFQKDNLEEALRVASRSISGVKPQADKIYSLCVLIEKTDWDIKRERCRETFKSSIEQWAEDSSYQYQYARYLSFIKEGEEALKHAIALYQKNPARIYLAWWIAEKSLQNEDYQVACDGFRFYLQHGRKEGTKQKIREYMADSPGLAAIKCSA
ncbi:hypothetical protein ACWIGM_25065 [Bosea sp. NPDC055332]